MEAMEPKTRGNISRIVDGRAVFFSAGVRDANLVRHTETSDCLEVGISRTSMRKDMLD